MPTYEYRCKECGHEFEAVQAFTDDALTECPSCKGALRKVFGNVGITFKGSGFYKTDSRSGSSATATSGSGSDSSKSDSSKSDSSTSDSSKSDSSSSTATKDSSSTSTTKTATST